jgi:integrase/recombinase XerD
LGSITIGGYKRVLAKVFRDLGTTRPSQKDIYQYVARMRERRYSYSHIKNSMAILECYMWFIGRRVSFTRPRKPMPMPKEVLTEGETARIIAATKNSREKAMIAILVYSGIRNKELCNLRSKDIDFENGTVKIYDGKYNRDGISQISRECCRVVAQYIGEYKREYDDFLFITVQAGVQYTGYALRKLVKVVSGRARIAKRVYPHLFRHSLATSLLNRGANIMTLP